MKNHTVDAKLKEKYVQLNPFVFQTPSVSETSIKISILLIIQIIFLAVSKSFLAIAVIAASSAGAMCAAYLCNFIQKKDNYTIHSVLIHGMMIGMLLPETYPPFSVFFITFLAIVMAKYFFVNCVNSWVNVVCLTVIIAWFIGKGFFPNFQVTSDIAALKNPSATMIQNGIFPIYSFDSKITALLNEKLLHLFKARLPEGFISLLWDSHSIIPAFRFNLLTILASIVLFSDGSFSTLISSIFLGVYVVLVRIFFPHMVGGSFNTGDIILAVCTSGTLFTAVFLIQWFGTVPVTILGRIIYAILAGVVAFFIVGCGTSPIGMCYTVVICNILNLIIRVIEEKQNDVFVKKLVEINSATINEELAK